MVRGNGEPVSIDARDPAHPQRLTPSRPPAAVNDEPLAKPAPSDRRIGLTPITLLLVLVVGYLLIQIQFVLVLVLLALVFATVIQTPVDALDRRHIPRPLAILLVYIGIIGAFTVLFMLLSPAIREQATAFREQAPQSLAELRGAWQASGNALLAGPGQQLLGRGIAFIQSPGQTQGVSVPQGAWLGGIPAVIIALTQGWEKGLLVIGFVVLLQLTENAVLVPRVMRGAVGLTPLTVFIAILVGTEFAGIPGALLAIPIAAVIQVMLSHYTEARREAKLAGL